MFQSTLFLNGTIPNLSLLPDLNHTTTIAADGGALRKLLVQGLKPKLVIGDGDSLEGSIPIEGIDIILDHDQETNDFEKCLQYIIQNKLGPTLVFGIGGGEIDHQHNNLHCFVKYSAAHPMIFFEAQADSHSKIGFVVRDALQLRASLGAIISLLPFPEACLSTQGLAWQLEHETLGLIQRSGARNRVTCPEVSIKIHSGSPVLIVIDADAIQSAHIDSWQIQDGSACFRFNPNS